MKSLSAPGAAALSSGHVPMATLVRIDFPSGTTALNTSSYDLVVGGVTYQGAAGLGRISPITDTPSQLPGFSLELLNVDSAHISVALDGADQVQGSPVTISTAILDPTTHQVLLVDPVWAGYADVMTVTEEGKSAVIGMSAESKGVDLLRGTPLLYNDGDQQSLVPGDLYFEYVVSQSDKPVIWPSREFFNK
jgi:hypothetical protein